MDYIANTLSKIINASKSGKLTVTFPYSTLGQSIMETLYKVGLIGAALRRGKKNKSIEITLLYNNDEPVIRGVKKLSSQSKRMYTTVSDIKQVRNGYGYVLISTPQGVMTGEDAKKAGVGGELLFEIW